MDRYNYVGSKSTGSARLRINYTFTNDSLQNQPLNILLLKHDNTDFFRIYPGRISFYEGLEEGLYKLVFYYSDSKYYTRDSIFVKPNGLNYYQIYEPSELNIDSGSIQVNKLINENIFKPVPKQKDAKKELEQIYNKYLESGKFTGKGDIITGFVYDEYGEPIPGTNIRINGTNIGTISDLNGYYSLKVPEFTTSLIFSFVGMKTVEQEIKTSNQNHVILIGESLGIDEVVVTAFGISREKKSLGYSVSSTSTNIPNSLSGRVPGLQIILRGTRSINSEQEALVIVNGKPFLGDPGIINNNDIISIEVLKGEDATAIYGSRAANGVILITTKSFSQKTGHLKNMKGLDFDNKHFEAVSKTNSIRNNFSDYAFWQPRLRTDKNGKAVFNVTFPDDVTNWQTFVLAMNGNNKTGQTQSGIKSFKPLMAQLSIPRFLIEGDISYAIGKSLNYTLDTIKIETHFELNDSTVFTKNQKCIHSVIDTLTLSTQSKDTLKIKYFLKKTDGYLDGEQRIVPVFQKGLMKTNGDFYVLDSDTTINLNFIDTLGLVKLFAQADVLDVTKIEISKIINYQYNCNEQMASKLKALIADEKIANFKNQKFNKKREIKRIIKKIENNQNKNGLWGWWNKSESSYWISIHILEALDKAEQMNYQVKINRNPIIDHTIWELESDISASKKIILLYLLKLNNANIAFNKYIQQIEKEPFLSAQNKIKLIEIKQLCGLKYDLDTILNNKNETIFGNYYFSGKSNESSLTNNEIQTTLIAYKVLRNDTLVSDKYLKKIRNYLFERKSNTTWQNTYETAQIIETILPDLLFENSEIEKPKMIISGYINDTITEFPYEIGFSPNNKLKIYKKGTYPIYLTTYQKYWSKNITKYNNDFEIITSFANGDNTLKAGKPGKLKVNLGIKKDTEYILIEVPIPAGCSYDSKKSYYPNEVHREFFKNKVVIFCNKLTKGNYQFEIDLLPRYSGVYTLNPAKIELMYFPTFNANNKMKKVVIK